MKELYFDVLVIGTGASGKGVAFTCAEKGLHVGIADNRPYGGTCELRGCDPKKVLVGITEALDGARNLEGKGIAFTDLHIDWQSLMQFKNTFVQNVPEMVESSFQKAGIEALHGTASFIDKNTVTIHDDKIHAKHIVLATGAMPIPLGISGEEHVALSDNFLELETLPKNIIFIGGGYISFEFAHLAKRAGAHVTILHRSSNVLSGFDQDIVEKLIYSTRQMGIDIILNAPVTGVERKEKSFIVHTTAVDSTKKECRADLVVHGAGRMPNLAELHLENAEVAYDSKRGIHVNEYLQNITNPSVYAVGDAASYGLPLTPVAGREGIIAARNIIDGNAIKADFRAIPSVVFTIPPLASVGLTEDQAKSQNIECMVKFEDTSSWYTSRRINEEVSAYKTIIEKDTNRILGAHILGYHAEEVINLFSLAITNNLTTDDLRKTLYTYPTKSSDISYMI